MLFTALLALPSWPDARSQCLFCV